MGLESVIEEVLARGKGEADDIRTAAHTERERMLQGVREEGEKLKRAREEAARRDAERNRVQVLARAELESKKMVLAAQKDVLDEVFRTASERLGTMADGAALLRKLLERERSDWQGGRVFSNAKDAPIVKPIVGANFAGTTESVGGIVVESADGTMRVDLRFESILSDVWSDAIREVADTLWPPA